MPSTISKRASAGTVPQDSSIADVKQGVSTALGAIQTEDERRAAGTDASMAEGVGDHDDSPAARAGQVPGGQVLDAYAQNSGSVHDSRSDPGAPLVLGQAPSAPAVPMKGSKDYNEKFHKDIPNAINRSPMVIGVDPETGKAPVVKTHADLKADLVEAEGDKDASTVEAEDDGTKTT